MDLLPSTTWSRRACSAWGWGCRQGLKVVWRQWKREALDVESKMKWPHLVPVSGRNHYFSSPSSFSHLHRKWRCTWHGRTARWLRGQTLWKWPCFLKLYWEKNEEKRLCAKAGSETSSALLVLAVCGQEYFLLEWEKDWAWKYEKREVFLICLSATRIRRFSSPKVEPKKGCTIKEPESQVWPFVAVLGIHAFVLDKYEVIIVFKNRLAIGI